MKEKKDQFERFITDNFEKLAKQEEDNLENDSDIHMPEGVRESVRAKLDDEIKKIEEQEAYAHLSEEDRRALELGRKLMQEKAEPQEESAREEADTGAKRKKTFRRRQIRVCLILAAALILVMAVGITSLGGPERVIQMLTQNVGEREVEKVNSSEDNLVIVEEDEEEAYQIINDKLGIEPVKLGNCPVGMKFQEMQYDSLMQTAELFYILNDEKIIYFINASYGETAMGIDLEDNCIEKYNIEVKGCDILITEYQVDNKSKMLAKFEYNNLEYFLLGQISKEEFETIIYGLYFLYY